MCPCLFLIISASNLRTWPKRPPKEGWAHLLSAGFLHASPKHNTWALRSHETQQEDIKPVHKIKPQVLTPNIYI